MNEWMKSTCLMFEYFKYDGQTLYLTVQSKRSLLFSSTDIATTGQ